MIQVFFFFTLVAGPGRSLTLELSDARVYEPQIRARLGTTPHFCDSGYHSTACGIQYVSDLTSNEISSYRRRVGDVTGDVNLEPHLISK